MTIARTCRKDGKPDLTVSRVPSARTPSNDPGPLVRSSHVRGSHSVALVGGEARPVRVEAHVGRQSEAFKLSGLPDTAVRRQKIGFGRRSPRPGSVFPIGRYGEPRTCRPPQGRDGLRPPDRPRHPRRQQGDPATPRTRCRRRRTCARRRCQGGIPRVRCRRAECQAERAVPRRHRCRR